MMKVRKNFTAVVIAELFILVFALNVCAQSLPEDWSAQTIGANGKMIGLDASNNVFVAGSFAPTATPITLVKYDPNGNKLWQQTFDVPNSGEEASWLAVDVFGNVVVTGHPVAGSSYNPVGLLTAKFDANGNLLWSDIVSNPRGMTVRCETDAAGSVYVFGRAWLTNQSGNTTDDFITIKYAPNGTKLWTRTISQNNFSVDTPTALVVAPDGKVAVTGSAGPGVFFTVLYDANGNLIWRNTYNGSSGANDVAFGPNGEVFVVGGSWTPQTSNVFAVVKYAANGAQDWAKLYTAGDVAYRIRVDSQGNLIITGIDSQGYLDWMTIKLDAAGNQLWSQRQNTHQYNDEIPYFMTLDPADAIYITGQGGPGPSSGNLSYLRMVTLKYSPAGTQEWSASTFTAAKGIGVRVGTDNKVYALGEYQTFTVRYTQTNQMPPPSPPSNLTAAPASSSQINLAWTDNSNNENFFHLERCQGAGCVNFGEVAQVNSNTTGFLDTGLAANTTYTYRVRASNSGGYSNYSNSASATTSSPACANLALGKTATASSSSGSNTPNLAVDGSAATFWRSSSGGTQYLQIDLGAGALNYSQVTINWRSTRFAKSFQIRVSNVANFSTFTKVFSTTAGAGGVQTIALSGAPRSERFIRLHMTAVNSSYYAVNEFEVCGFSSSPAPKAAPDLAEAATPIPPNVVLHPNYPNPFNPSTTLRFSLPQAMKVTLKIYNLAGEEVATLVDGVRSAGMHTAVFAAAEFPSGVYFAVLQTGQTRQVRRLLLLR